MNGNGISDNAGIALAHSLSENRVIERCYVANNHISEATLSAIKYVTVGHQWLIYVQYSFEEKYYGKG